MTARAQVVRVMALAQVTALTVPWVAAMRQVMAPLQLDK